NVHDFYENLFIDTPLLIESVKDVHIGNKSSERKLLASYNTGKYDILKIDIFKNSSEIEKNYKVKFFYKGELRQDYFEYIIQDIYQNLEIAEFDQLITLENLIKIYNREAIRILNLKYNLSTLEKKQLSLISALKKIKFEKLFPLLIDDNIEEIFLDSPKDEIYINHQTYGRCRTKIRLNSNEIDRIKTFIRLYSGQRLDFLNPSIKFVIKNKYFYCRFSIDVEPIQINNFALDIRKLNKNILTIQDLLKNRTIDPLIASFLYFNILRRKNITVTGETDTGKTTLINALDMLTPKEFRKIYVESITESLNQFEFGKHQLKYRVDNIEELILHSHSKSNQIKTLLHRTPDIIYLGEILKKDEAEAMFHCLAAGLRGFQTIHSRDLDSLMNRFLFHFKINRSCLGDLDLIVLMKKELNERRIVGVFEICRSPSIKNKLYKSIFEYNPEISNWLLTKSLYESSVISDLAKYENLPKGKFLLLIETFNEIFEYLLKYKKLSNLELVDLFHKISYYSLRSIDQLKHFWSDWKKTRSLNL
ncbi:MAG: ATPase, T2SS/T4P/T4SS family, partial [Candidatus Thorarchaeota archaeon]